MGLECLLSQIFRRDVYLNAIQVCLGHVDRSLPKWSKHTDSAIGFRGREFANLDGVTTRQNRIFKSPICPYVRSARAPQAQAHLCRARTSQKYARSVQASRQSLCRAPDVGREPVFALADLRSFLQQQCQIRLRLTDRKRCNIGSRNSAVRQIEALRMDHLRWTYVGCQHHGL